MARLLIIYPTPLHGPVNRGVRARSQNRIELWFPSQPRRLPSKWESGVSCGAGCLAVRLFSLSHKVFSHQCSLWAVCSGPINGAAVPHERSMRSIIKSSQAPTWWVHQFYLANPCPLSLITIGLDSLRNCITFSRDSDKYINSAPYVIELLPFICRECSSNFQNDLSYHHHLTFV